MKEQIVLLTFRPLCSILLAKGGIIMADYKRMYLHLFGQVSEIIEKLQKAQAMCEDIYIETSEDEDETEGEKTEN